ncbi:Density-regulated protein related to translation initiation factor 1 (eIF-1/SUI1) [Phaffia rhodozyma]|uniref:Translation machinery-associated protein 22 n=1 Tax=Phaffia rhodozyma TaxID=264483 RepID=A0A0F7SNQ5_PHARH|nr:Density-regulated protein related to translation initiation factor 1 (eIF-1/SUI1) [Phaffia rhodozyma]
MQSSDSIPGPSKPEAKSVIYCQVCTWPIEYCEFSPSSSKCKTWLQDNHSDLFERYYSADALQKKMGTLSVEGEKKLEQDVEKQEKKARKKAEKEEENKKALKVTIKRIERNKRKYVTTVQGLEFFGIDLKKAAKLFAQKFATGSSVTKNPQGQDDITVQGDVTEEISDILTSPSGKEAAIFGKDGLPEKSISKVEEKPKKKAEVVI